jgi:NADH:ubiquinone oxidoreductase subunit F (NADH-binding)/(2Fe-2S) ferredoxin/NAD-dependent dihydropyrimidine dehydrogenase PreA subunit
MSRLTDAQDLARFRKKAIFQRNAKPLSISICSGTGCRAYGAEKVADAFEKEVERQGLGHRVAIRRTGCHGFCQHGPLVIIQPKGLCYLGVQVKDVGSIMDKSVLGDERINGLLYLDESTGRRASRVEEIPFYRHQKRILLENNVLIDAADIHDYISVNGYWALAKALTQMSPEQVLCEVMDANLRGRGGAGFPVGKKWETARNAPGEPKYVVVNADEGDPGAYMDRSLLEGNPHSILEGLLIGAYAIGASEGYLYVRQEYPLACKHAQIAIEQARELGLLGEDILGSGFSFNVKIHRGAGAFVSGESSALMTAIEGHVGEPRAKYVHTSEKGIWGKPTCLNNVETWANIPFIIKNGAKWFRSIGTPSSSGTKIFSLVGNVKNTGLVEVPMGISLHDIVFKIGGGVPGGKKFKGVQTGGPSGGVIPESLLDLPVDFDELTKAGSMMGSGGLIVMDEHTCMVDTARYYIHFLAHESCGKCVPCREGLRQMLHILDNIISGNGKESDLDLLEELSAFMEDAALCALGRTAPNPVRSTIQYFRDEYIAHIREKRCPAGVCKPLIAYEIDQEKCEACGSCERSCTVGAIEGAEAKVFTINQEKCIKCGACYSECSEIFGAVRKVPAAFIGMQPAVARM